MKKGLPAKFVTLAGNMTVLGMNTRNLDAVRDGWELHLHIETGGVFITTKDAVTFVGANFIHNVDLVTPLADEHAHSDAAPDAVPETPVMTTAKVTTAPKAMLAPLKEDVEKGARNLADDVLKELGASDAESKPSPAPRRKRK